MPYPSAAGRRRLRRAQAGNGITPQADIHGQPPGRVSAHPPSSSDNARLIDQRFPAGGVWQGSSGSERGGSAGGSYLSGDNSDKSIGLSVTVSDRRFAHDFNVSRVGSRESRRSNTRAISLTRTRSDPSREGSVRATKRSILARLTSCNACTNSNTTFSRSSPWTTTRYPIFPESPTRSTSCRQDPPTRPMAFRNSSPSKSAIAWFVPSQTKPIVAVNPWPALFCANAFIFFRFRSFCLARRVMSKISPGRSGPS